MTDAQREQVDQLFGDLLDLDLAAQTAALARVEDPEVRAEVASLLDHSGSGEKGLNTSIGNLMQAATDSGAFEDRAIGPGTRFERYRIERKLGQGGMGDVYEATRDNDFHKQVALKIVRYGLDSDFARSRFQQERQTLAGLEHPYIARLIDGGESSNGCPYLVLEFVDGVPINDYTETCTRDEIIALFLKVCEAVEYAHRNLIIHRDLKPANILVTADGTPKLLDFGIAKLLSANADTTQTMAIALTPQYASPEQIRNGPITTASDVYSLGVILYQLLTKRKPYHLENTTAIELDRIVCEQPPAPPALGNELDDILLMSLRKEAERRYPSVPAFADDLRRFTAGRPVLAAPDTFSYRSRKFIGLHKIGLAAVAAVILVLAGGLASTLYQKRQADQRFAQVRKLSNTFLFDINDQLADVAGTTKTRAFVVKTAQEYLDNLSRSAGSDPALQAEVAQSYARVADAQGAPRQANLGDRAGAEANYRRSIALYEPLLKRHPEYAADAVQSWRRLAFLYTTDLRLKEAQTACDHAFALAASLEKDNTPASLQTLSVLYQTAGDLEYANGNQPKNIEYLRKSQQYLKQWSAVQQGGDAVAILAQIGVAHLRLGRALALLPDLAGAEAELRQAVQFISQALEKQPANVRYIRNLISAQTSLGVLYDSDSTPNLERFPDAADANLGLQQLWKPLLDADPHDISGRVSYIRSLTSLAYESLRAKRGDALAPARQALALWTDIASSPALSTADQMGVLDELRRSVIVLAMSGMLPNAKTLAAADLRERRKLLGPLPPTNDDLWYIVKDLQTAAQVARAAGDGAEADHLFAEALRTAQPFAEAADRLVPTAFVASDFYAALRRDRSATGRCAEAAQWQEKEAHVWRFLAPSNSYAATRLQTAENAPKTCPAKIKNFFFDE